VNVRVGSLAGRNLDKVRDAYRDEAGENIAFVQMDVADEVQAKAAVQVLTERSTGVTPIRETMAHRRSAPGERT
jgi:hypothetical protein